jgi:hypothetical protein
MCPRAVVETGPVAVVPLTTYEVLYVSVNVPVASANRPVPPVIVTTFVP